MSSLPSGLPETVGLDEDIARFIRCSKYVRANQTIKHNAFLPAPDNDTSTFRINGLNNEEVGAIAVEHVKEKAKNGAAVCKAKVIAQAELLLVPEEPPFQHANIRGWAMDEDDAAKKSKRMEQAQKLAEESKFMNWEIQYVPS